MKVSELLRFFESKVPPLLQEGYDNSGLQVGDTDQELTGVLVAVDVSEAVLKEALSVGANLVITHHPILFHALKKITPRSYVERCVAYALKHDLVLYAAHTNLDNSPIGLNHYWAHKMGLQSCRALLPLSDYHYKLTTYLPVGDADRLRTAFWGAQLGQQGDYTGCSFSTDGVGRFCPGEQAHPHVGKPHEWHAEREEMVSILLRRDQLTLAREVIAATHPYEEPAVDLYPLRYRDPLIGAGIIGTLPTPIPFGEFMERLKSWQPIRNVAHSKILRDPIQKVAYCGGSGAFLIREAAGQGADLFITGEAKYNDFWDAQDLVTLATIGHYESEQLSVQLLTDILSEKKGTFVLHKANSCENPIHYVK